MKSAIVIPSFNPSEKIIELIDRIKKFSQIIIVVDDGSNEITNQFFEQIKNVENVVVLKHTENRGKGAALKTGFRFLLELKQPFDWIVTCDDDLQHDPDDIFNLLAEAQKETLAKVLLGTRFFSRQVPLKSLLGNTVINFLLRKKLNKNFSDSQTGLRCFRYNLLDEMLVIEENCFDFEIKCLIRLFPKYHFREIPIKTKYFNGNQRTRFKPIRDSIKILKSAINE